MTTSDGAEGSFLVVATRYKHVRPDGDTYPKVLHASSGMQVDPFIEAAHAAQREGVVVDVQGYDRGLFGTREAFYLVDVAPERSDDERAYRDPQYALRVVHRIALQADRAVREGVIA